MKYRRRLQHPGRESRHKRLAEGLLLSFLSRYDKKGGLRLVQLWKEWPQIVGPDVAELAHPVGHKEGALLLAAEDSVAAQQLSYYAPELLERVNAFFGEEVFDKVRFELLDGRAPLDGNQAGQAPSVPEPRRAAAFTPPHVGGLMDRADPETAAGRCYLAYVRRFKEAQAGAAKADSAADDANTRPDRASRRRK